MDKDIKVTVQPIVDTSFIKNIQAIVNKVPIKIKVQIDTGAIDKLQNEYPALKLKLDTSQITKETQIFTEQTEDTFKTLSENLSKLYNITGFNPVAKLGLEGLKIIIDNQSLSNVNNELEEIGTGYNTVTEHAEKFNNTLSQLGTHSQDKNLVNGFLDVGTAIINIVDKVGLLNTALAGLSVYAASKGVG